MEIVLKAGSLLERTHEIILTSTSREGYPRPCVVTKCKSEGIRRFWVATGSNSVKVRHFMENPKAGACFYQNGHSVTLTGKVKLQKNPDIKAQMWVDWFINHFPGGVEDPNYCLLEFTTEEAILWIDSEFITVGRELL